MATPTHCALSWFVCRVERVIQIYCGYMQSFRAETEPGSVFLTPCPPSSMSFSMLSCGCQGLYIMSAEVRRYIGFSVTGLLSSKIPVSVLSTGERSVPELRGVIPNSFKHIFDHINRSTDEVMG